MESIKVSAYLLYRTEALREVELISRAKTREKPGEFETCPIAAPVSSTWLFKVSGLPVASFVTFSAALILNTISRLLRAYGLRRGGFWKGTKQLSGRRPLDRKRQRLCYLIVVFTLTLERKCSGLRWNNYRTNKREVENLIYVMRGPSAGQ